MQHTFSPSSERRRCILTIEEQESYLNIASDQTALFNMCHCMLAQKPRGRKKLRTTWEYNKRTHSRLI